MCGIEGFVVSNVPTCDKLSKFEFSSITVRSSDSELENWRDSMSPGCQYRGVNASFQADKMGAKYLLENLQACESDRDHHTH
jgi:hypothetical protein